MPKTNTYPPEPAKVEQPWTPAEVGEEYPTKKDVDEMMLAFLLQITGYDATKAQMLTHGVGGVPAWVDITE